MSDEHQLMAFVRGCGEALADGLRRAETLTGSWRDRDLADGLVDAALSECMARLASTGVWGPANQLPSGELWRVAGPLLEVGVLQHAARFKPHGYAGDYEMLERISGNVCCDHPLGRAFDRFFQSQAAPHAVRARTDAAAAAIVAHCLRNDGAGGRFRVASVGAGPAVDVRRAVAMLPEGRRRDVEVCLVDLDPNALEFAKRKLVEGSLLGEPVVECHRANLFRLPKWAPAADALGQPDVLICSGLFDYLDDEPAVAMLELFWRTLASRGLMLVGNFAPHNPTRAYMEWVGNWYLKYRSAEELKELGRCAGIPAQCLAVRAERLGIDLFLIGRKGESREPSAVP